MAASTPRKSADERRVEVLHAALSAFARGGYVGTSTAEIAGRVGVSQPYLFRLFANKKQLFLAVVDLSFTRIRDTMARAAEGKSGEAARDAMGGAYKHLLGDRDLLLFQLQLHAACVDDEIADAARGHWQRLWSFITAVSEMDGEGLMTYFAQGMAFNVLAAIRLPEDDPMWSCLMSFDDRLDRSDDRSDD